MPRDVVALVSADDFVGVIRVYSDRVHDLLVRSGVPTQESVEVAETYALSLLDAVVNAPETVVDLAGWWFARTIELTGRGGYAATTTAPEDSASVLAGTDTEEQVREALGGLPESERLAVVLRDVYDLPPPAVAVALGRDEAAAVELTAAGRLRLTSAYEDRWVPDLSGHSGRTTVDLAALSRLADGTLLPARAAPLRRHLGACSACDAMLEALARGRRLAAGLPIVAMDDDAREALIDRVATRAAVVLPSHEAVLRAVDEDDDPRTAVSPLVIALALALSLLLGIAIAVISHNEQSHGPVTGVGPTLAPPVTSLFTVQPTAHRHRSTTPSASASASHTPKGSPTQSLAPTLSPTPVIAPSAAHPALSISPTSGPAGTIVLVTGSGWAPETAVTVTYASRSPVSARVGVDGTFTAAIRASSPLFGERKVTATGDGRSVTVFFRQQL